MESQLTKIIGIVALLGGLLLVPATPAQAGQIDGPQGGQTCGMTSTHSQPDSTTVRIKITLKCWGAIVGIGNYVSYQRSGKYVGRDQSECTNRQLVSPFSCSVSYDLSDPGGSQKFEAMNEWTIWFGRGPLCFPNGDFPDCNSAEKNGVTNIPPFTS